MSEAHDLNRGARKLEGAMLEHSGFAIERMPGLVFAVNKFAAEAPLRLSALIPAISGAGSIEGVRATTLFRAIGDCSDLTAAIYSSADPEARLLIALDERVDDLVVSSIFGEMISGDSGADRGGAGSGPRTAIETALLEEFARALGMALESAFAPLIPLSLSFERLVTLSDSFALGRRDAEAAAARFSLPMPRGACECLVLFSQTLLLPFREELARDPEEETAAADRRWARLVEAGVQQTRLPVAAILEEIPMSLGDIANLQIGGVLPLGVTDFNAIRLECSGRGMFVCKLGQGEGRYRLEVEGPDRAGPEDGVIPRRLR